MAVNAFTETAKLIIAKTLSGLDQIVEARRCLENNQQMGKIVVTVSETQDECGFQRTSRWE